VVKRATLLSAALLALCGLAPQDPAPPDELADALRQLRELREGHYRRQRERSAAVEAARRPLRQLETETADLKAREGQVAKDLAEVRADLEKLRARREELDGLEQALKGSLDGAVREGRAFVEAGPPFKREERLARAAAASSGSSAGESLSRHWAFLQDELRLARSGEAWTAEVPLPGGRRKPARCFRVGHLAAGYVTEDGAEAGRWDGRAWVPAATPEEAKALRAAVDTLDRLQAPALIPLKVPSR
jgi:hypothetical protein